MIRRNFSRHKGFFFINLIGLSTGLTCVAIIYLWVFDEWSVDKFHENDSHLFQIMRESHTPNGVLTFEGVPGLLPTALSQEIPEAEYVTAVVPPSLLPRCVVSVKDDSYFKISGQFVGKDFFNVFTYDLVAGDKQKVMADKNSIAISDELAKNIFGTTENIVGKTLKCDIGEFSGLYPISGIFKKVPRNSSAQFDLLFNYELFLEKRPNLMNWENNNPTVYVVLRKDADVKAFNNKIYDFIKSKHSESTSTLFARQYSQKYLYGQYEMGVQTVGRIVYVKLFSLIAVFILIIACINFMNLSTALASKRVKEVGIKKTVGANRKTLIYQYLGESVMTAFISLILAMVLVPLILPQFNQITGKDLSLRFDLYFILFLLVIALLTGICSGAYSAFYVSGVKTIAVLKGKIIASQRNFWAQRSLVIFQYTISIVLIVAVLIVHDQMTFIRSKNLGYNRDNVIYFERDGKLQGDLETFLSEVKKIPGVVNASSMRYDIKGGYGFTGGLSWEGKKPDEKIDFWNLEIGHDLIEMLDIKMKDGRSFSRDFRSDSAALIFNEAGIRAMGMENPIGKTVVLWGENRHIIGVVKDFNFESLHELVKPCFFRLSSGNRNVVVKIRAGTELETIDRLGQFYRDYNPGFSFDFKFLDDNYQALYASERSVAILSRYFAGMAIILSCLGIFALAAFTVQKRTKEIGIRKVLGSSNVNIVFLLSNDFTKIVIVSILISIPVSYLLAKNWLDSFVYKIDLGPWYFVGAALLSLFLVWATIGLQILNASRINPTNTLRISE